MKKTLLIGFSLFTSLSTFSQDLTTNEAILLSHNKVTGTARFQAMSGAFGALGGDFSALSVNPAGSTVFSNNQLGISFTNTNVNNRTTYFGDSFDTANNNLKVGQLSGVFVFKDTTQTNNWKKLAVGITYESSSKFNNNMVAIGTNNKNSIGDYFASLASTSGFNKDDFLIAPNENLDDRYIDFGVGSGYHSQLAFLGHEAYLISENDDVTTTNTTEFASYSSNPTDATLEYHQQKSIISSGESGKISANIALEYRDVLSFGLNLNNHFIKYNRSISIVESNPWVNKEGFNFANYETFISTIGSGFSFNIGALAKIKSLRLGAAFQSSTWYSLSDEYSHKISYKSFDGVSERYDGVVNPYVTMTLPSYRFQTPNKTTFSAAYIFGKRALISLDYSIKNYANIKYKPTNQEAFRAINSQIQQELQNTFELSGGAEYRIKRISLRGGLKFQESPYKNGIGVGNYYQGSLGFGYSLGRASFNAAYSRSIQSIHDQVLELNVTDSYSTVVRTNYVTATLLVEM